MTVDDARGPSAGLPPPPFSASMSPLSVLHLCGELDLANAPALRAALDGMTKAEVVTVDLAEVTFMDSSAVHALLFAHEAGGQRPIILLGASPAARRVLELCGVDHLFEHR